ncbi:hypothetical protein PAMP_008930 [Pampus punctatissimus]
MGKISKCGCSLGRWGTEPPGQTCGGSLVDEGGRGERILLGLRRMWTYTLSLRPAGVTFDSGRDLLFSYSDERLCLPSDNCSFRGRERSINQNELRYCTTPLPMADSSMPQQPPGQTRRHRLQRNLAGQDAVVLR